MDGRSTESRRTQDRAREGYRSETAYRNLCTARSFPSVEVFREKLDERIKEAQKLSGEMAPSRLESIIGECAAEASEAHIPGDQLVVPEPEFVRSKIS